MNNRNIVIIAIVIVIIIAAALLLPGQREEATTPLPSSTQTETSPPEAVMEEAEVEITAQGFSPAELTIRAGTTIRFTNKDADLRWPASGIHPTHQLCPGFDSLKGLQPGESYSFTFLQPKTCPMHDHLNPQLRGSIIVQ